MFRRRHHKLVNKEFQEEIKQKQGKYFLSEQFWQEEDKVQWAGKKAFLKKDAHRKLKKALLEGNSGKHEGIFQK